jgi:hypothetical protein
VAQVVSSVVALYKRLGGAEAPVRCREWLLWQFDQFPSLLDNYEVRPVCLAALAY